MKVILIVVAIAVIAYLILNSSKNSAPHIEACAKDVIQLLRKRKDANAPEIADIFSRHNIEASELDELSTRIKAKISQARISKDDQALVMLEIRKAKELLK